MPDVNASFIIRAVVPGSPGTFGKVVTAVGEAGGRVGAADIVRSTSTQVTRDYLVFARDSAHADHIAATISSLEGASVDSVTSRVMDAHRGGAIGMRTRAPIATRDDLSMAYTPGVARVCMAIHHDFEQAWDYTIKSNSVMVVSDGSDVEGVGDVSAEASLPACEATSLLLRELAGIDAFPLPVDARDPGKITEAVALCSSMFAGIHLTGISAPRSVEIRDALATRLDIPVLLEAQDAQAAVVLAGLTNALALAGTALASATVAVTGQSAVGAQWFIRLLSAAGVGTVTDEPAGADALVRFDRPATGACLDALGDRAIVFDVTGLSAEASVRAAIYASNVPGVANQLTPAIAIPGLWKGALDVRATAINDEMLLAAVAALAAACRDEDGNVVDGVVVPSVISAHVVGDVAAAVAAAAEASGVARTQVRA
jgi:malate dehydrogenase (oxaloacetate-decarboxylating)